MLCEALRREESAPQGLGITKNIISPPMPVGVGGLNFALFVEKSEDGGANVAAFDFVVFIIEEDDDFAPAKVIENFQNPTEVYWHKPSVNKKLGLGQLLAEK